MPDVTVERRNAPRYPMVLAAEAIELPRGARLTARTSNLSCAGCYIDTLNSIPQGTQVRVRISHDQEMFEAVGKVVYVSPGLGMGICFTEVPDAQMVMLDKWLERRNGEF